MDVIRWRDDFETGVTTMDQQHKKLIQLINQLFEIIRDKKGDEAIQQILAELTHYSEEHLKAEEALLAEHDYPELTDQKDNHAEFIAEMNRLKKQLEADQRAVAPEIYKYLRKWWVGHIVGIDRKYGPYLNERGVK